MAYSNTTPNRKLPQWDGNEKPEREDYNRAFQIMDAIGSTITLRPPSFDTKTELDTAYPSGDGIYSHVAGGVIYVWAGEWVATGVDLGGYYTAAQIDEMLETVSGLPVGGTTGQVLKKSSDTDGDVEWADEEGGSSVPVGGTTGQVLAKTSNTDGDAAWKSPGDLSVTSTEAGSLANISATETIGSIIGKLRKWFTSAAAGLFSQTTIAGVWAFLGLGLTADKTIYVATTGSDTAGDGSSGNPYKTIQKGHNAILKNLNGFTGTVSVAAGTYNESVLVSGYYGGNLVLAFNGSVTVNGQIKYVGNKAYITSTGDVTIAASIAGEGALDIADSNVRYFQNVTISNTGTTCAGIRCTSMASVIVGNDTTNVVINLTGTGNKAVEGSSAARVSVGNVSGNAINGFTAHAGDIKVAASTITATTKVVKTQGGMVLTGAGVNLT